MFNHDWFHGQAYREQLDEAKRRCLKAHFSEGGVGAESDEGKLDSFRCELEVRTLIYLRDGFSYEVRVIAEVSSKSHLVFECEPVDEQYKVGAFVVTVPFDEIVRVEVFAVHPSEKPEDSPQITGFRGHPEPADHKHDTRPMKPSR